MLNAIRRQKLFVRTTDNLIKNLSKQKTAVPEPDGDDLYLQQIADELKRTLSTQLEL